jgi:putative SOS response-associated peptidase YedK
MTFAGLWERWTGADGPALETFTIIVGPTNEEVRPYHDRMPAVLDPEEFDAWLDPDAAPGDLHALLRPYAGALSIQPVSPAVNNPRNHSAVLIEPLPTP